MPEWIKNAYVGAICYTGYRDRYPLLIKELERVGITKVHTHWSFPNPFRDALLRNIPHIKMLDERPGCWGATITHYRVLKTAYELGYSHAFIVEDDCRFLKNTEQVWKTVQDAPADWNILMLDSFTHNGVQKVENGKWAMCASAESTGCYAVDRKAMSALIDLYERPASGHEANAILRNSDHWTKKQFLGDKIKFYLATPNLAIQVKVGATSNCGQYVFDQYKKIGLDIETYQGR